MVGYSGFSSQKGDVSRQPSERVHSRLLFWDDMEDLVPKAIGVTATTGEVTTSSGTQGTVMPYEGAKMLQVSDASAITNQVKYIFGPNKSESLTQQVRFQKDVDLADMVLEFNLYDKVTLETYKLRFLESGMKLQYWNSAGAYADVTGGALDIADNTWNTITLCINPVSKKYVYLRINDHQISLAGISAQTAADAVTEGQNVIIFGANTKANDDDSFYDDFRVYSNEVKVS